MDVLQNQDEFRETLGVSFQEDRLFPYLSVMNHLIFYGMVNFLIFLPIIFVNELEQFSNYEYSNAAKGVFSKRGYRRSGKLFGENGNVRRKTFMDEKYNRSDEKKIEFHDFSDGGF